MVLCTVGWANVLFIAGKVPLSKVKFDAKLEWEYISNFKVLQDSFNKVGISKVLHLHPLLFSQC